MDCGSGNGDTVAMAALVVSAVSVLVSLAGLYFTRQAALRGLLQQQLNAYLEAYQFALAEGGVPGTVREFDQLAPQQQRRVEILAGQLVGVIELMKDTGDARHRSWLSFLSALPGAIDRYDDFRLEDYARQTRTRREIARIRRDLEEAGGSRR
jgi:hypothetical protein